MARLRIYVYFCSNLHAHIGCTTWKIIFTGSFSLLSVHRPPPLLQVKHKSPPPRDRNIKQPLFFATILDLRTVSLTKAIITEKKKEKKEKEIITRHSGVMDL